MFRAAGLKFVSWLGLVCLMVGSATAEELEGRTEKIPNLRIVADSLQEPWTTVLRPKEQSERSAAADGGELLRAVPGVSGVRMGGHGIDPLIRGQGQSRLNVLLDGARVYGGCPNRMDPPTSYASQHGYDRIDIQRGSQTVIHGGGGTAGVVSYQRSVPKFETGKRYQADASAFYGANGKRRDLAGDIAGRWQGVGARGLLGYSKARDYRDGDSKKVRSGYEVADAAVLVSYDSGGANRVDGAWEGSRGEDILFAGAGMDALRSDHELGRLNYELKRDKGALSGIRVESYYSTVDHLMDNYTLRIKPQEQSFLKAPSDTQAVGGRAFLLFEVSGVKATLGSDLHDANWNASRFAGGSAESVNKLQSVLWPDVERLEWGAFSQWQVELSDFTNLNIGFRYTYYDTSTGDASLRPAGSSLSPNELYQTYYGELAQDEQDRTWGGFLRLDQEVISERLMLYGLFSRAERIADQTERYIASNGITAAARWVGNPQLDSEQQYQLEGGFSWRKDSLRMDLSLFYNWVRDYILRDRARAQQGVLQGDLATIYRNIQARLWGGELVAEWEVLDCLNLRGNASYVYATNTTDNRAIAQIPPLHGELTVVYELFPLSAGLRVRWAAKQTRVDDDPKTGSGLDAGQTSGWAVADLFAEYFISKHLSLRAGVDNVFDRTYAEHLNKSSAFEVTQVQINEPGIGAWIGVAGKY